MSHTCRQMSSGLHLDTWISGSLAPSDMILLVREMVKIFYIKLN